MKPKFFTLHLDFLGFSASMLCAAHCMAIPILVTVGAVGGVTWMEAPWTEATFIGLSFVLATWSLTRSFLVHHRHLRAIRVVTIGFLLLIMSRLVAHELEPILAVLGGGMIAGAHWVNWRLCRHCTTKKGDDQPTAARFHSFEKMGRSSKI